jgi:hypothetical protein
MSYVSVKIGRRAKRHGKISGRKTETKLAIFNLTYPWKDFTDNINRKWQEFIADVLLSFSYRPSARLRKEIYDRYIYPYFW